MSDQKDDQALEEYLKGNSALSSRYRTESAAEQPPTHVDAEIIAAAKKAVEDKKSGSARWYVPLSLAAIVVICFSVVFKIYDEESMPGSKQITPAVEKSATMQDERLDSFSSDTVEIMKDAMRSRGEASGIEEEKNIRAKILKREAVPPSASEINEDIGASRESTDSYLEKETRSQPALEAPARKLAPATATPDWNKQDLDKLKSGTAAKSEITSSLSPEQWFEIINQLWFEGDEKGAYAGLEKFLAVYPDYPLEQLKDNIPEGMKIPVITQ